MIWVSRINSGQLEHNEDLSAVIHHDLDLPIWKHMLFFCVRMLQACSWEHYCSDTEHSCSIRNIPDYIFYKEIPSFILLAAKNRQHEMAFVEWKAVSPCYSISSWLYLVRNYHLIDQLFLLLCAHVQCQKKMWRERKLFAMQKPVR